MIFFHRSTCFPKGGGVKRRRTFKIDPANVVYENFEDEVVIVHFETGNYYSLEKTGADIWNLIAAGRTVDDIVEDLSRRYAHAPADMEGAVDLFMSELEQEHLIMPIEPGATDTVQAQAQPPASPFHGRDPAYTPPTLQRYTDMKDMLLLDPIHEVDETGWPAAKPDVREEDD
jgi:hypothetical protein